MVPLGWRSLSWDCGEAKEEQSRCIRQWVKLAHVQRTLHPSHRLAVVVLDVMGVWDGKEVVPPFLVFLQVLEEGAWKNGLVLQRNLWYRNRRETFESLKSLSVHSEPRGLTMVIIQMINRHSSLICEQHRCDTQNNEPRGTSLLQRSLAGVWNKSRAFREDFVPCGEAAEVAGFLLPLRQSELCWTELPRTAAHTNAQTQQSPFRSELQTQTHDTHDTIKSAQMFHDERKEKTWIWVTKQIKRACLSLQALLLFLFGSYLQQSSLPNYHNLTRSSGLKWHFL